MPDCGAMGILFYRRLMVAEVGSWCMEQQLSRFVLRELKKPLRKIRPSNHNRLIFIVSLSDGLYLLVEYAGGTQTRSASRLAHVDGL